MPSRDKQPLQPKPCKAAERQARQERLAKALRDNLRRRRQQRQERTREDDGGEPGR